MNGKLHPLLLLLLFLGNLSYAQNYCGFDLLMEHFHVHPNDRAQLSETEELILDQTLALRSLPLLNEQTIPVVVHVIHENGEENIPDAQIELAIDQLNDAFANQGDFQHPDGIDVPIRFCLAGTDPEGNFTNGIIRVEDTLTEMFVPSEDQALKDLSRWDPTRYLNICWLNRSHENPTTQELWVMPHSLISMEPTTMG